MPAVFETGHAKNVANFEDLINFVTSYGGTYNPTKNALKLPQLNTLLTQAKADLAAVTIKNTAFNNAVNSRMAAFDPIKTLSTKLINALSATDATSQLIKDARTIVRKIHGSRAKPVVASQDPNTPAPTTISVSQLSYDQLIEHFNKLIELLKTEPSYAPNENELKIAALTVTLTGLKTSNTNVSTSYVMVSNSRIARDKTLYKESTGLVDIALQVKAYVMAVYGSSSAEYKQVKHINFRTILRN